ncbi:MAG TPA: hypothetical protein VMH40_09415 [Myxococcaceae bacterium]|nr:hypothetical protein [Myxococcaceae bacterium]
MKLFSFVVWLAWGAILARVLLAPFWGMSVNQGMFLLLVGAPAVGVLSGLGWLFRHTGPSLRS